MTALRDDRVFVVSLPVEFTENPTEVRVTGSKIETKEGDLLIFDRDLRLVAGFGRGQWLRFREDCGPAER